MTDTLKKAVAASRAKARKLSCVEEHHDYTVLAYERAMDAFEAAVRWRAVCSMLCVDGPHVGFCKKLRLTYRRYAREA